MAKWYSGTLGDLKLPDICLTGEEKPRKSLTQETCPDRGLNPGPLRDRRTCHRLSHIGELLRFNLIIYINPNKQIADYFSYLKFINDIKVITQKNTCPETC